MFLLCVFFLSKEASSCVSVGRCLSWSSTYLAIRSWGVTLLRNAKGLLVGTQTKKKTRGFSCFRTIERNQKQARDVGVSAPAHLRIDHRGGGCALLVVRGETRSLRGGGGGVGVVVEENKRKEADEDETREDEGGSEPSSRLADGSRAKLRYGGSRGAP